MRIQTNSFVLSATRTYILIVLSALCYFILAYYTQRYQFYTLFILFSILFGAYLLILKTELPINQLVFAAFFFRLIFLIAVPALSTDIYRFIWDGRLLVNGIHPFVLLPSQLINNPTLNIQGINHEIFEKLNSPEYYSIYPPFCQFTFWIAALISQEHIFLFIVVLRILFLAAEFATISLLLRLFKIYNFNQKYTAIYFLNPLVKPPFIT